MSWKTNLLAGLTGASALLGNLTAAHADDFILDLPDTIISLGEVRSENDKGITNKYKLRVRGRVVGPVHTNDRVQVEWKAAGKTVSTLECDLQGSDGEAPFACEGDDARPLDQYGDLQAVFSYVDDSEDATIPLYTMNLKVGRFWNWYQRGKKTLHYPKYQLVLSDLPGSAVVWHQRRDYGSRNVGPIELITYMAFDGNGWSSGGENLRCAVDGKKLGDFEAGPGDHQLTETIDWRGPDADKHEVKWSRMRFAPTNLLWGVAADLTDEGDKTNHKSGAITLLGDHPGDWSCDWRKKGKVLRTFTFTVGADGRVAPHAEQAAGLKLPASESVVTVSFPDDVFDPYFDPTAIKAGGFFGRPWADPATAKAMKLGKARGPIELAPPKGAKGGTAVKAKK